MRSATPTLDINATFRGGGRSVEWLDEINKASIVMLAETGIVPKDVARRIAKGIAEVIENERTLAPLINLHSKIYCKYLI